MNVSLLVSTYNWKEALGLCLQSIFAQTRLPDEIVVADDGSGEDTVELVRAYAKKSPAPLLHVWHPHAGFQAAKIRNRGIAATRGDYIVQVDGDMIVERHFIEDHRRLAKPRMFVQGKPPNLSPEATRRVLESPTIRLGPFSRGVAKWWHRRYLLRSSFLSAIFSSVDRRLGGFGCNMSYWRSDALRINGYDEQFVGWGFEDTDFAQRLLNLGLRRRHVRHLACGAHLHHAVRGQTSGTVNERLFLQRQELGAIRCARGIDFHLHGRGAANLLQPH